MMDLVVLKRMGVVPRFIGALFLPLLLVSAYLLVIQWRYHGQGNHNTAPVFVAAIAIGSLFVFTAPLHLGYRLLLAALYIPALWIALFFYSLLFILTVFHTTIG
jgi:hypothetical protein